MCCEFNRYPVAGANYGCGYPGAGYPVAGAGFGPRNNFALIVVLFILLIIIGTSRSEKHC